MTGGEKLRQKKVYFKQAYGHALPAFCIFSHLGQYSGAVELLFLPHIFQQT
jgi:hypothetical protein